MAGDAPEVLLGGGGSQESFERGWCSNPSNPGRRTGLEGRLRSRPPPALLLSWLGPLCVPPVTSMTLDPCPHFSQGPLRPQHWCPQSVTCRAFTALRLLWSAWPDATRPGSETSPDQFSKNERGNLGLHCRQPKPRPLRSLNGKRTAHFPGRNSATRATPCPSLKHFQTNSRFDTFL